MQNVLSGFASVNFFFDVPHVQVNCVQVRGVLHPNIAIVKSVFKLHCYMITVPWVFSSVPQHCHSKISV